ncbi:MAG: hypothetical protein U0939_17305 [Pirellulales bacterium]
MNVKLPYVVGSILLTACCWGTYGPLLHIGQESLGGNRLRAFLCVGLAYFLIAVVVPIFVMSSSGKKATWTIRGLAWSFAAGCVGALGALGIILAFNYGGLPVYVMPLVFGCAPVVNSFWTIYWQKTWKEINAFFAAGLILVAIGAMTVLFFAPTKPPKKVSTAPAAAPSVAPAAKLTPTRFNSAEQNGDAAAEGPKAASDADKPADAKNNDAPSKDAQSKDVAAKAAPTKDAQSQAAKPTDSKPASIRWPLVIASVAMTACCWGIYGPVLHWGQMGLGGNRMQAFLCVGLAYFAIAVIAPAVLLGGSVLEGWSFTGVIWSLLGGGVGAVGALGLILAFNYGGKPIYVMPLVFGCAPVVNSFFTMYKQGTWGEVNAFFAAGLILAAVGAMTVLFFAPVQHKAPEKPKAAEGPSSESKPDAAPEGESKS